MVGHTLSVVVPVFNVAQYLGDCLASLDQQVGVNLDVILVDDGSTDGSGEIAEAYAGGRRGWTTIRVSNGGPGRARNIGLQVASGEFVAFLDADDLLPPDTYARMIDTMDAAQSDVATGRVVEFASHGSWPSGLHRRAMPWPVASTTLGAYPTLVFDSTAGNKMYRRDFLASHGLTFPEGVLYEDLVFTADAFSRAAGISVLADPVLFWRVRGPGQASTTQRRAELGNLRARLTALGRVDAILAGGRSQAPRRMHDVKAVEHDLRLAVEAAPDAVAADRHVYLDEIRRFLQRIPEPVWMGLPVRLRLAYWLLAQGRDRALLSLLADDDISLRPRRSGRRTVAEPLAGDVRFTDVPADLFDTTSEHPVATQLEGMRWTRAGARLSLRAHVEGMPSATPTTTIRRLVLRRDRRDTWLPSWPSRRRLGGTVGDASWDGVEGYAHASSLAAGGVGRRATRVVLQVAAPGLLRSAYVDSAWNAYAQEPPPVVLSPRTRGGRVVWPHFAGDGLRVAAHEAPVLVDALVSGGRARLCVQTGGRTPVSLELRRPGSLDGPRVPLRGREDRWEAVVLPEHLPSEPRTWWGRHWAVWVLFADESAAQVVYGVQGARPITWSDGGLVALDVGDTGYVRLAHYPEALVVDGLALRQRGHEAVLGVAGSGPSDWEDAVLRVVSGPHTVASSQVLWRLGRWSARVTVALPAGEVLTVCCAPRGESAGTPVRCGVAAISKVLTEAPQVNGIPLASVTRDRRLLLGDLTRMRGRPAATGAGP